MLKTVATGLVAYALVFTLNGGSANAEALNIPVSNVSNSAAVRLTAVVEETQSLEDAKALLEAAATEAEQEVTHVVVDNESLSDIAKMHNTTWKRLFDRNETIETPDIVNPGETIIIPRDDEQLTLRDLPLPPVSQPSIRAQSATTSTRIVAATSAAPVVARAAVSGNTYAYGYCTWYVKNVRPDLPNRLGNADTWASRARAQGFATGSVPRVGAVAQAVTGYMHVAYVTGVNGDGTVNLSEMNYSGWGVVSTRTAPASAFTYIY
jgi:surface antigen